MHVALSRTCVSFVLALGSVAALADGPTDVFDNINACTEAATQQQAGLVVGWKIVSTKEPVTLTVDVLAADDRVWTMNCSEGKIVGSPERKLGNKNYKMLSSRTKVPEVSARFTAASSYPISEMLKMEYGLSWKGKAYFTYELKLSDGREATVDVNANTGQIDRSKSERKS
jgi:hypothetical protein